jgi:hypothetical protein
MNAYNQLLDYYLANDKLDWLGEDLEMHAQQGVVYLSPELCLLARPVSSSMTDAEIIDIQSKDLTYKVDTWMIHIMTGKMAKVINVIPYLLPYVAFQRNGGRLRRYKLQTILRHGIHEAKSTSSTEDSTT